MENSPWWRSKKIWLVAVFVVAAHGLLLYAVYQTKNENACGFHCPLRREFGSGQRPFRDGFPALFLFLSPQAMERLRRHPAGANIPHPSG
ncbi:MAG: hypothetical protein K9K88_01995 [Desulfobacterales bacterium]|nr:hypothetical protein [Desulfobacterales bacterium]